MPGQKEDRHLIDHFLGVEPLPGLRQLGTQQGAGRVDGPPHVRRYQSDNALCLGCRQGSDLVPAPA